MTTTSRILALTALMFSTASLAQTSPADPSKNTGTSGQGMAMTGDADWDALDSNKDGFLTKDELTGSPALVHNFDKIDTNKDGKISMDEWKAYGHKK
jgi:EF hand domain-containing protein